PLPGEDIPMHNRIYGNDKILYRGQSLMLQWRGGREFVARKGVSGVVAVIAITDEGEVLLLDNYRPALRENIIELPGGLAGDLPGREHETLADAALREL